MIKKILFLMAVCLVAADKTRMTKNLNDNEIQQAICNPTVTKGDTDTVVQKLKQCLTQKRQAKLTKRAAGTQDLVDMVKSNFNMEKMIQGLRALSEAVQQKVTITESKVTIQQNNTKPSLNLMMTQMIKMNTLTKLKCDENRKLKIINARLTTDNYKTLCESTLKHTDEKTQDMLADLNDLCDENVKTLGKTVRKCDNQNECQINIDTDYSGICDCTQQKYLEVTFTCVDSQTKSRSKRALHYRNEPNEIERERRFRRRIAQAEGLEFLLNQQYNGYGLYGGGSVYGPVGAAYYDPLAYYYYAGLGK